MSVNLEFFAALLKLLQERFGNRLVGLEAWNGMIAAAGEVERAYLACEPLGPPHEIEDEADEG